MNNCVVLILVEMKSMIIIVLDNHRLPHITAAGKYSIRLTECILFTNIATSQDFRIECIKSVVLTRIINPNNSTKIMTFDDNSYFRLLFANDL